MKQIIAWFVHNPIAVTLMMLIIVIGGFTALPGMDKEFFPYRDMNQLSISVSYPGAGPSEVEQQICKRIEDAIHDLDGIDEMRSFAYESYGQVNVYVALGYDSQRLLNDVKSRVDAISTFPAEAERPEVKEILWRSRMVSVALAGDIEEAELKSLGERLREEMAALPDVSIVELREPRAYELAIEVSEQNLRRYGLTFSDVSNAVKQSSVNLPAGKIRAENGDIQIQTRGQDYVAADFENIVVLRNIDGGVVRVADVATVHDGFVERDVTAHFNKKNALALEVFATLNPDVLKTSEAVKAYIKRVAPTLPESVELTVWRDMSVGFRDRLKTLTNNGLGGLVLVFIVLMLFLRPMLAFWVSVGIAIAFTGTLWLLPITGVSLNMMTLFAFLLILGIVVDDAIIVGESIHSYQQRGGDYKEGAIAGANAVLKPVIFAVITTMIFFSGMFFLPGEAVQTASAIPKVVILALSFSLLECLLILPAHLGGIKVAKPASHSITRFFERIRKRCADVLVYLARNVYRPMLNRLLQWQSLTFSGFIIALAIVISIYAGGWLRTAFFPVVPADFVFATATLPQGVAFNETEGVLKKIEKAAGELKAQLNQAESSVVENIEAVAYDNTARVIISLNRANKKRMSAREVSQKWEALIGPLKEAESFDINYTIMPLGKAIDLQIAAPDVKTLEIVSEELRQALGRFEGVYNIRDSLESEKQEIEIRLKPEAESLSLTLAEVARQVRQGFYGEEVQRIPREREDVRVMVRYPREERSLESALHDMYIRTASGMEVPFERVAEVSYVAGYRKITRIDRRRIAQVTADLQPGGTTAAEIIQAVKDQNLTSWQQRYPGLQLDLKGEQSERADFASAMLRVTLLAMLVSFGLMAIVFRSYWQPILVLTAVPFGFMGAIIGHMLMGRELSMLSLLGIIACAGVVVNDNLVLIDRINKLREEGLQLVDAVVQGGQDRFRPILLTSVTTFIGLLPIMSESSTQAQFLIPMVVSLAFGVLLATPVTLIFVPILYIIGDRVRQMLLLHWYQLRKSVSEMR